jgi:UDP-N-acetylmuramate--alanine ligase
MNWQTQPLHFTGIGGIGMSGLAELCHALGCPVTGSDVKLSGITERLATLGVGVSEGHAASFVPEDAKALIVTSAVNESNPEVAEARRRGLPIVHRGELLAELMRTRRGVAVGGSHGKTTTSSLLSCIALQAGLDPTVFIGTIVPFLGGTNARLGGELFISECDESDGSFLELTPVYGIITNVDREHLDHYGTFENVCSAFVQFANRTAFHGTVAVCVDDAEVRRLLPRIRRRITTYGHSPEATLRIVDDSTTGEGSRFRLLRGSEDLGEFKLHVLGAHNILNATAAAAIALELGLSPQQIREGLARYQGTGRRMEFKGREQDITVIDDYGHHPTEVRATLDALRLTAPHRLVVLFQPHRYTRTRALLNEFATAFQSADAVRVLDIYAASEPPIEGINSQVLVERIQAAGHPDCVYAGSLAGAVASVLVELQPGDTVLTLGAGSITQAGPLILKGLKQETLHG